MKKITLALLLFATEAPFAQKHEMSILNNRFYLVLPQSARNIARATDIMAPGPNENNETRIVYNEGAKRLVFFANELYTKTTADLAGKLKQEATQDNPFTVATLPSGDSVIAVKLTPQKFDKTQKAILIKSLVIQNADSTLSKVSAYINPAAFADKSRFEEMADRAFDSFRKGNRRLLLAAHTDSFAIMGTKSKLRLKLPPGYIITKDRAEDFEVFQVKNVLGYDDKEASTIIVYFGYYPSMVSKEYGMADFKKPDSQQVLMFHSGPWENFYDPARNLYLREQLFDDDEIEKGMKMHIAILSNSKQRVEEMSGIVKDLLIVYDPSHVK